MNALKEQLATAQTQNKSSTGDQVNNKMADCEQQTLELISRNNIEGELASKDKEVSIILFSYFFFKILSSFKDTKYSFP